MESLDYWRLCDELNLIQAALLIVGEDPSRDHTYIEDWNIEDRAPGYEAAKAALSRACLNREIEGKYVAIRDVDINGNFAEWLDGTINLAESTVRVADLKIWLRRRGVKTGFFFPAEDEVPGYLDRDHPRYAQKLAASVTAWLAIESEADLGGKSPKQTLTRWLREHSAEFGLTDEEGKLNELGIDECAKVANWRERGGAPRTPSANPPTIKG